VHSARSCVDEPIAMRSASSADAAQMTSSPPAARPAAHLARGRACLPTIAAYISRARIPRTVAAYHCAPPCAVGTRGARGVG
jgi:hypothetical protein